MFPEHLLCARLCLGAGNTGVMNKTVVALGTFYVFPYNFSLPPSDVHEMKTLTKRIMFHFSRPTKEYQVCCERERERSCQRENSQFCGSLPEQGVHFCQPLFKKSHVPHPMPIHMLPSQFTFITCTAGEQQSLPPTLYRTDWQLGLKAIEISYWSRVIKVLPLGSCDACTLTAAVKCHTNAITFITRGQVLLHENKKLILCLILSPSLGWVGLWQLHWQVPKQGHSGWAGLVLSSWHGFSFVPCQCLLVVCGVTCTLKASLAGRKKRPYPAILRGPIMPWPHGPALVCFVDVAWSCWELNFSLEWMLEITL